MEKTKQKSHVFLALFVSLLTSIIGAGIFGVVYGFSYYIFYLTLVEIILSVTVFFKVGKKITAGTTFLAIIWNVVWLFALNVVAIFVCEAYFISGAFDSSLIDALKNVLQSWMLNSDVQTFLNKRFIEVGATIGIGTFVYSIIYAIIIKKIGHNNQETSQPQQNFQPVQPQEQNTTNENPLAEQQVEENVQPENTENETQPYVPEQVQPMSDEIYQSLYYECKNAINKFSENKDVEYFKFMLKEITNKQIAPLSSREIEIALSFSNNALQTNNSIQDKKTNEVLSKLLSETLKKRHQ